MAGAIPIVNAAVADREYLSVWAVGKTLSRLLDHVNIDVLNLNMQIQFVV